MKRQRNQNRKGYLRQGDRVIIKKLGLFGKVKYSRRAGTPGNSRAEIVVEIDAGERVTVAIAPIELTKLEVAK